MQLDWVTEFFVQILPPAVVPTVLGCVDSDAVQLLAAENPIVGPCTVPTEPRAEILPIDVPSTLRILLP